LFGRWLLWTRRIAFALGAAGALASPAGADPITYVMTGLASGQLDARPFTDAPFLIALTADTSGATWIAPGVACNSTTSAIFTIGNMEFGAIITQTSVADNAAFNLIALVRGRCIELGPMWMNGRNEVFGSYDLTGNVEPVALALPSAPPGVELDTTAGILVFTGVHGLAFEARVARPPVIPAVSNGALALLSLLVALGGIAALRPRRAG